MRRRVQRGWPSRLFGAGLVMVAAVAPSGTASAFTPASPQVQRMVDRAIQYLEKYGGTDDRVGAQALVGIALLKVEKSPDHPAIVHAVRRIQSVVHSASDPADLEIGDPIYSAAQAVIFLSMLEPVEYGSEIQALLQFLQARQRLVYPKSGTRPFGGWGYPITHPSYGSRCDTSMTQNAVLALWEANRAGFRIPTEMLDAVTIWLVKSQDPSGGYPYQGRPAEGFELVNQSDIRPSMTAAGLGSLYILSELLSLEKEAREQEKKNDLPPGVRKVGQKEPARSKSRVDPGLVRAALGRGKGWFQKNYRIDQGVWNLYYLYSLERYHTFREVAEGRIESEPKWYNDGVRWLMDAQLSSGCWGSQAQPAVAAGGRALDTGRTVAPESVPATAFGVLFLVRSTKKSIQHQFSYGDGTLIGGRGFPRHMAEGVAVRNGKMVARRELASLDKVLAALEDSASPEYTEVLEALAELPSDEAGPLVSKYAKILRRMADDPSPEARLAAVRALSKDPNLDHVPTLIYALTDHPVVMREARDGLRRVSRKFRGFGLSDNPTKAELYAAIQQWKAWYRAIRPDAKFED